MRTVTLVLPETRDVPNMAPLHVEIRSDGIMRSTWGDALLWPQWSNAGSTNSARLVDALGHEALVAAALSILQEENPA